MGSHGAALYLVGTRKQETARRNRSRWGSDRALRVVDVPRSLSPWTSEDDLRVHLSDHCRGESWLQLEVGVLARPWGQSRSERVSPRHERNLRDLEVLLRAPPDSALWSAIGGLWYFPAWTVTQGSGRRQVSIPEGLSSAVVEHNAIGGSGFVPHVGGGRQLAQPSHPHFSYAELSREVIVLHVAGPYYAPGLVPPGLVLGLYAYVRDDSGRFVRSESQRVASLRHAYVGAMMPEVPETNGVLRLPGEPLKEIAQGDLSLLRMLIKLSHAERKLVHD